LVFTVKQFFKSRQSKIRQEVFSRIYKNNFWKNSQSISGPGSTLERFHDFREELTVLLKQLNTKSLLDVACGDFNWMKELDIDLDFYFGIDIVPEIIRENQKSYGTPVRKFIQLDFVEDPLPRADVVFCRDTLVHLTLNDIQSTILNMRKSNSTYLLATTFKDRTENPEIETGDWRPINLQRPPFNLEPPICLIDEKCHHTNGIYADKRLGLWKLNCIQVFANE